MVDPVPRRATSADVPAITALVVSAFTKYVERIGMAPAPMLADYAALLGEGRVWVIDGDDDDGPGELLGVIVDLPRADHLLVDTVAVAPAAAGSGLGRILLDRADLDAVELGFPEIRLSTNEAMTENLEYYPRRGFQETGRGLEDGYRRVFFTRPVGERFR